MLPDIKETDIEGYATMNENNVVELNNPETNSDPLTELVRAGAGQLIERAVEIELQKFMAQYETSRTADGKAGVVRNGYLPEKNIQTGIGPVRGEKCFLAIEDRVEVTQSNQVAA